MKKILLTLLILLIPTLAFSTSRIEVVPGSDIVGFTDWTITGCTSHYDCVDEGQAHDENTTYINSTTVSEIDKFIVADSGFTSGVTVANVIVYMVHTVEAGVCNFPNGCCCVRLLADHDSLYTDTEVCLGGVEGFYAVDSFDITGQENWQWDDFNGDSNALNIGVEYSNDAGYCRVTSVYVLIDYEEVV